MACTSAAARGAIANGGAPDLCRDPTLSQVPREKYHEYWTTIYKGAQYDGASARAVQAAGSALAADTRTPGRFALQADLRADPNTYTHAGLGLGQTFSWDGTGPATRTVTARLDVGGTNFGTSSDFWGANGPSSTAYSELGLYSVAPSDLNADLSSAARSGYLAFMGEPGYRYEWIWHFDREPLPPSTVLSIQLTLEPGRIYVLAAGVGVATRFGGAATGLLDISLDPQGLLWAAPSDVPERTSWIEASPVPEPSMLAMLVFGLGAVGMAARRRRAG